MIRRAGRTSACSRSDAVRRLAHADAFLALAEIDPFSQSGPVRSASVSNAVLAAIAAADAICCVRIGVRSSGEDHGSAARLLLDAGASGAAAAERLSSLVGVKTKAQYESVDPSVSEAKRALRSAREIVAIARELL